MFINKAVYQSFIEIGKPDTLAFEPMSKMSSAPEIPFNRSRCITAFDKVLNVNIRTGIEY